MALHLTLCPTCQYYKMSKSDMPLDELRRTKVVSTGPTEGRRLSDLRARRKYKVWIRNGPSLSSPKGKADLLWKKQNPPQKQKSPKWIAGMAGDVQTWSQEMCESASSSLSLCSLLLLFLLLLLLLLLLLRLLCLCLISPPLLYILYMCIYMCIYKSSASSFSVDLSLSDEVGPVLGG